MQEGGPLRRTLHRAPELGYREHATAKTIMQVLEREGIPVVGRLAGTGIVAAITRGSSGRTIGLRADMDGLAVTETSGVVYASTSPGVMHACGHDGHMAVLLTAATALARHGEFDGTVILIFQPAEEGGGGAQTMISEGLFARWPVDHVFALHNWPGLPVGHIAVSPGPVMASTNDFRVLLTGPGGHVAFPHATAPLTSLAAEIVRGFDAIAGTALDPMTQAVIATTQIRGGTTVNAHPTSLDIRGTVRAFSERDVTEIERRMRGVVDRAVHGHRAAGEVTVTSSYPPTVNDRTAARIARDAALDVVPVHHLHEQRAAMTSEDFAFMLHEQPGAYLFLGVGDTPALHSPDFDFPDEAIPVGAALFVAIAERALRPEDGEAARAE